MAVALPAAEQQCREFSLDKMNSATGKFAEANLIGAGGFGQVYRGVIKSRNRSETVAVKRLNYEQSKQGWSEFVMEIRTLSKIRHRNVVSLIGYCHKKREMILVYEFVENKTLADRLSDPSFTWEQRLKALIGAGRGLQHLHTGIPGNSVVNRDVKSSNILLDLNFEAKISDFGLAKLLSLDNSESDFSMTMKGTFGYIDRFFAGAASDTYSFGVVVLEVLCGRKALDKSLPGEEWALSDWALKKEAREIVAQNVSGEISEACLNMCFVIAKRCLLSVPEQRPTMIQVVAGLELALIANQPSATRPESTQEEDLNLVEFNRLLQGEGGGGGGGGGDSLYAEEEAKEEEEKEEEDEEKEEEVKEEEEEEEEEEVEEEEEEIHAPALSVAYLQRLTNNWKNWIGNGPCGAYVYWGVVQETGETMEAVRAIKWLRQKLTDQEFRSQVSTQSLLKHKNVEELLGFCGDDGVQIFVSEFAAKGSLCDCLHGRRGPDGLWYVLNPALSWIQRIGIAVEAAAGLCYIHERGLIHHNIKSSNVLLFANGSAKITDLHMSSWCSCKAYLPYDQLRHPCFYYHPPGFGSYTPLQSCDVYSFGVVLTELLTGMHVSDTRFVATRQNIATSTALKIIGWSGMPAILDPRIAGSYYPRKAVEEMAAVAASCLGWKASSRPDMSTVVSKLRRALWEAGNFERDLQRQSRRIIS